MTVLEIIGTICPALAESKVASKYIRLAEENTDRKYFGKQYAYAVAYRACHLYSITDVSSGGATAGLGQISSMHEGGISVSFAASGSNAAASGGLESSKYGIMLLGLINSRPHLGVNTAGLPLCR